MVRILVLLLAGIICVRPAAAATNILFVVDASGSMWEQVDGKPKITIAKQVLSDTLAALPAQPRLGLMTYGRRSKGDCSDIEVLSPIGKDSHAAIAAKVAALTPKGETPIAASLAKAAGQFQKSSADHNQIVLITDGAEECRGDPCAAARQLVSTGLDLHINVVGFSLQKKERAAVECVAREGNGQYYDAKDAAGLTSAMKSVSSDVLQPTRPQGVNLLAGGETIAVPDADWAKPIDGKDHDFAYVRDGREGIYAFKDEKTATVSKFAVLIAGQNIDNPKQIEVLAADDLPSGNFRSLGIFDVQNLRAKSLYQEFAIPPTRARYIKIKLISFYGHDAGRVHPAANLARGRILERSRHSIHRGDRRQYAGRWFSRNGTGGRLGQAHQRQGWRFRLCPRRSGRHLCF